MPSNKATFGINFDTSQLRVGLDMLTRVNYLLTDINRKNIGIGGGGLFGGALGGAMGGGGGSAASIAGSATGALGGGVGRSHGRSHGSLAYNAATIGSYGLGQGSFTSRILGSAAGLGAGGFAAIGGVFALTTALNKSVDAFAKFEKAADKVAAISDANIVGAAQLSMSARRIGAATPFTPIEAAQAQGVFAQAGFNTSQILKATLPAINLATVGGISAEQSALMGARTLSQFNMPASQLKNINDKIAYTAFHSPSTIPEIGRALQRLAPTATAFGTSQNSVLTLIAALSKAGLPGSKGTTVISSMIPRLAAPSARAQGYLNKMGVSTLDEKGNLRDVMDILLEMKEALHVLGGTGAQAQGMKEILGVRAMRNVLSFHMQDTAWVREMKKALDDVAGYTEIKAKQMTDNMTGAWKKFSSASTDTLIKMGGGFSGGWVQSGLEGVASALQPSVVDRDKIYEQYLEKNQELRGLAYSHGLSPKVLKRQLNFFRKSNPGYDWTYGLSGEEIIKSIPSEEKKASDALNLDKLISKRGLLNKLRENRFSGENIYRHQYLTTREIESNKITGGMYGTIITPIVGGGYMTAKDDTGVNRFINDLFVHDRFKFKAIEDVLIRDIAHLESMDLEEEAEKEIRAKGEGTLGETGSGGAGDRNSLVHRIDTGARRTTNYTVNVNISEMNVYGSEELKEEMTMAIEEAVQSVTIKGDTHN